VRCCCRCWICGINWGIVLSVVHFNQNCAERLPMRMKAFVGTVREAWADGSLRSVLREPQRRKTSVAHSRTRHGARGTTISYSLVESGTCTSIVRWRHARRSAETVLGPSAPWDRPLGSWWNSSTYLSGHRPLVSVQPECAAMWISRAKTTWREMFTNLDTEEDLRLIRKKHSFRLSKNNFSRKIVEPLATLAGSRTGGTKQFLDAVLQKNFASACSEGRWKECESRSVIYSTWKKME